MHHRRRAPRARTRLRGALTGVIVVVAVATSSGCSSPHSTARSQPRHPTSTTVAVPPYPVEVRNGVVFARTRGVALALDAYLPGAGPRPRPAVVLVHGGGWQGGTRAEGRVPGAVLAAQGIAAFSIDYRIPPVVATAWPAEVDDVQRAIRWVRRHARDYGVDPGRIGVAGSSAGGTLAGVVAANGRGRTGAQVRAGALFSAPTDLLAMAEACRHLGPGCTFGGAAVAAAALYFYVGLQAREHPDLWAAASPIGHVNRKSAPMLVVNAAEEAIPASQATTLGDRLAKARVAHTVDIVPGGGHGFELVPAVWPEMVAFFRRYL